MSESMDFSDMFRRSDQEVSKNVGGKSLTDHLNAKNASVPMQENIPPMNNYAEHDSLAFVKNTLKGMNIELSSNDLSKPALKAIEMLISEVDAHPILHFSIARL